MPSSSSLLLLSWLFLVPCWASSLDASSITTTTYPTISTQSTNLLLVVSTHIERNSSSMDDTTLALTVEEVPLLNQIIKDTPLLIEEWKCSSIKCFAKQNLTLSIPCNNNNNNNKNKQRTLLVSLWRYSSNSNEKILLTRRLTTLSSVRRMAKLSLVAVIASSSETIRFGWWDCLLVSLSMIAPVLYLKQTIAESSIQEPPRLIRRIPHDLQRLLEDEDKDDEDRNSHPHQSTFSVMNSIFSTPPENKSSIAEATTKIKTQGVLAISNCAPTASHSSNKSPFKMLQPPDETTNHDPPQQKEMTRTSDPSNNDISLPPLRSRTKEQSISTMKDSALKDSNRFHFYETKEHKDNLDGLARDPIGSLNEEEGRHQNDSTSLSNSSDDVSKDDHNPIYSKRPIESNAVENNKDAGGEEQETSTILGNETVDTQSKEFHLKNDEETIKDIEKLDIPGHSLASSSPQHRWRSGEVLTQFSKGTQDIATGSSEKKDEDQSKKTNLVYLGSIAADFHESRRSQQFDAILSIKNTKFTTTKDRNGLTSTESKSYTSGTLSPDSDYNSVADEATMLATSIHGALNPKKMHSLDHKNTATDLAIPSVDERSVNDTNRPKMQKLLSRKRSHKSAVQEEEEVFRRSSSSKKPRPFRNSSIIPDWQPSIRLQGISQSFLEDDKADSWVS